MDAVKHAGGGLSEPVGGNGSPGASPATAGLRFSQLHDDTRSRYVITSQGTFHLTPTELQLLCVIEELDGRPISRAALAAHLHRNPTVIGRLLSRLRREGVIRSEAIYQEDGGQSANRWLIAPDAHPLAGEGQ